MIFALADYLLYRTQLGPYKPGRLESQGWIPATPENFQAANAPIPGSGFVMHTQDSVLSWVIMYMTQHPASHAAIFGEAGTVIDATTARVIKHPLTDYLDGRSYLLVEPRERRTADEQREGLEWTETRVGAGYDWLLAASLGNRILYGADRSRPPHFRLWADVMVSLVVLSLPRRWIRWWPDLVTRVGARYLRTLSLNQLPFTTERPWEAVALAFEPYLARRGIRIHRPEMQSAVRPRRDRPTRAQADGAC